MLPDKVRMSTSLHQSPNPVSIVAVQCCYSSHQTVPWLKGEEGGKNSFWVIYSGGSGLNQGAAAVWLTYFDLSSSMFSLPKFSLFFIMFLSFSFPCSTLKIYFAQSTFYCDRSNTSKCHGNDCIYWCSLGCLWKEPTSRLMQTEPVFAETNTQFHLFLPK